MSNQMMQFDGPEGQEFSPDPDPRYIYRDRDPREQSQEEQGQEGQRFYEEGYAYRGQEGLPLYGEKLRPRPVKRRVRWWVPLLVTLLVLLLPMMGYMFAPHSEISVPDVRFPMHMKDRGTQEYMYKLSSTQGRTLIIRDNNGSVQVHTGDSGSSVVDIQTSGFRFGDRGNGSAPLVVDPALNDPNSTASSMTVAVPPSSDSFSGVNLDVTVPQGMNVQVVTTDGSITADQVNGQVAFSSQSGSITLENSTISGISTLNTGSGSINFDGSIDQNGSYNFTSDSGSINVSLPQNTSFHLQAASGSSTVNNDFGRNDVGSSPRPPLVVHSNSGSINIQQSNP